MVSKTRVLRALCAVFLICTVLLGSFANPAYADTSSATANLPTQEDVKIPDFAEDIGAAMAITGMATGIGLATHGASLTVATITTSAPGILGALGLGVTSTVALPVAGVVGATGLAGYGVYRGIEYARHVSEKKSSE